MMEKEKVKKTEADPVRQKYDFSKESNKINFFKDVERFRESKDFSKFFDGLMDYLEYNIEKWGLVSKIGVEAYKSVQMPGINGAPSKQVIIPIDNDAIMRETCLLKGRCMAYQGVKTFLESSLEEDKNGKIRIKQRDRK